MHSHACRPWPGPIGPRRMPDRRALALRILRLLRHLAVLGAFTFVVGFAQTITAEEHGYRLDEVSQGTLLYRGERNGGVERYRAAVRLHTDVTMKVTGLILRARVRQQFRNDTAQWQEGLYVFPLPENAAVDRLRMRVGDRLIQGQIKERALAKTIYTKAKRSGKAASLIEQERPNLFTTSVANIPPGRDIVVEIEYQQTLRYDNGEIGLRFPLAITPRYIPGQAHAARPQCTGWSPDTDQVPDASRITPPFVFNGEKINPVELRVELDAGMALSAIASPSHALDMTRHGAGRVTIALAENAQPSDRDFVLNWRPRESGAARTALFTETHGDRTYHLLMVVPPLAEHIEQPLGRDVVFVIDTSGSMGGVSIRQARRALLDALSRLSSQDRFNVIQFNSTTGQLFNAVQPASPVNIARARDYVARLHAGGGTEMRPALERALRAGEEHHNVRQVIFLTDGAVGNERGLFTVIHRHLGRSRLYPIGIGSAPNSHFMRKAAQFGRGTYTYIGNAQQVQAKMQALFDKLAHPVLQDLHAVMDDGTEMEMWPQRLPDVYAGEPLMVTLRTTDPEGRLRFQGRHGARPWRRSLALSEARKGRGIAALWARYKIAALMDRLTEGYSKELIRQQVLEVALTHHLVSRYTSLVAVDVVRLRDPDTPVERQTLPVNLPHGQKASNYIGDLARTATPMRVLLLAALLLLAVATGLFITALARPRCHGPP